MDKCQICHNCTCGRHHCKRHAPPQAVKGTYNTTATSDFPAHGVTARQQPIKPQQRRQENKPFEGTSTHKQDFTPYDPSIGRVKPIRPGNSRAAPPAFTGQASSHSDYVPHPIEKQAGYAPKQAYSTPNVPFGGETTSGSSYTPHSPGQKAQSMRPQANRAAPPPFAGKSEAHENFVSKTPDPPRSFKPKNAYTPSQAKFSSETTASSAYTGEPTTRASPMKPRSTRPAELPPFAGTTTLKADYPAHEVSKRAPIKPESRPMESKPFSGTTTANASYQPFTNVAPARSMKPVNARSTPPKFEGQPVSKSGKSNYQAHDLTDRVQPIRPKQQQRVNAPGDYRTTMSEDMKPWTGAERALPAKPRNSRQSPPPFVGSTTQKDSFIGYSPDKRESYKPKNAYSPSRAPFDPTTTAARDFQPHQFESICPIERRPRNTYEISTCDHAAHPHTHPASPTKRH